jgi:acylphosphatase/4-amino-4-deoxy-L-arabinose transferase-like glycosyltransferase
MLITYRQLAEIIIIFICSLILFTCGLNSQEIIGFDSRFYLFAQEMWLYGLSWFPTTYHSPYPDYPATSTVVIYLLAKLMGGLNKFVAVLPTAILAAITVTLTYMIGNLQHKRWGLCAVIFMLLTGAFVKNARAISLDMYTTVITTSCFYLIYSADKLKSPSRAIWIYPLILLGFAFRGPIGLVIPTGVVCTYYLLNKKIKYFFLHGILALLLLCACTALLLALAYHTGGEAFMQNVLRMEILGRMDNHFLPRYFYFTNSIGNYALAYPVAWLVLIGAAYYAYTARYKSSGTFLLLQLFGWMMIILIGMSIPEDKKVRYILPMLPAITLIAAYPFVAPSSQYYFTLLRKIMLRVFFVFPFIMFIATIALKLYSNKHPLHANIYYQYIGMMLVALQTFNIIIYFMRLHAREIIILCVAALSFLIINAYVLDPIEIYNNRARDFVRMIDAKRVRDQARLVFYKERPDGLPIKYLINRGSIDQPVFIDNLAELNSFTAPAYFVTSVANYAELQFHLIAKNTLGHVPVVVFTNGSNVMTKEICIHCYVSGKVQGVWFRASTQEQAKRLNITGWARNLSDGRVEVLACGKKENIAELYAWLKHGPQGANVTDLSYEEQAWQELQGFNIM